MIPDSDNTITNTFFSGLSSINFISSVINTPTKYPSKRKPIIAVSILYQSIMDNYRAFNITKQLRLSRTVLAEIK